MRNVFLTNSLSGKKELFIPDNKVVTIYVCGPTVYDRPHIGNLRSAVVYDVLYRLLKIVFDQVLYVRNITDIDDKIVDKAIDLKEDPQKIATKYTSIYHQDLHSLYCLKPAIEPKVLDHIEDIQMMIKKLIDRGHAYEADGNILFDISSYPKYGSFSGRNVKDMISGARIEIADYKKNSEDFVLWKNTEDFTFASPWGPGRPGWHIECSAMSTKYLSCNFDIHGGGSDLIFPHHENEIAQSICAHENSRYANYWIHNGFLTVRGEKMSKSLGNVITLQEIKQNNISMNALRYFYLTSHYRKPLDYNDKAILDASKAIEKFTDITFSYHQTKDRNLKDYLNHQAIEFLCDDLNTPLFLSYLHELASKKDGKNLLLSCELLGFQLFDNKEDVKTTIPSNIIELAEKRKKYREEKDWLNADKIKEEIKKYGYNIRDEKNHYKLTLF